MNIILEKINCTYFFEFAPTKSNKTLNQTERSLVFLINQFYESSVGYNFKTQTFSQKHFQMVTKFCKNKISFFNYFLQAMPIDK